MAMPCCLGGKVSSRIDWDMGWSAPPPMPCRILKNTRLWRFQANPQSRELRVNMDIESMR